MGIRCALLMVLVLLSSFARPAAAAQDDDRLVLECIVNGRSTGKIGEFAQGPDGMLRALVGDLADMGLRLPESVVPDADGWVPLSAIGALQWRVDVAGQVLHVTVPPALLSSGMVMVPAARTVPLESGRGASLDYEFVHTRGGGLVSTAGQLDARAFSGRDVVSTGALAYRDPLGGSYKVVRLDSAYTRSDPATLRRRRIGDFISAGLDWTRPVRLGGAQIGSDFALRPDLVTMPVPLVSGSVAVPSTVDVFVNGVRAFSRSVDPGAFRIPQLPLVSGANSVSLVVTDLLGRQTTETLPIYTSVNMLARGLQVFSLEAGAVRRNFGVAGADYGPVVASANWRRGISDRATAQAHAEGGGHLLMAGAGGLWRWRDLAVLSGAVAASGAGGHRAGLLSLGAAHAGPAWSAGAVATFAGRGFRDIAAQQLDPYPTRRLNIATGWSPPHLGSFNIAYSRVHRPAAAWASPSVAGQPQVLPIGDQHISLASLGYSRQVGTMSVFVNAFRDFENRNGGLSIGVSIPLGTRSSASLAAGSGPAGSYRQVQASRVPVAVGEFGHQLYAQQGVSERAMGELQYKSGVALLAGGVDVQGGQAVTRLRAQGSVAYAGGRAFLSNRINDAFAVVDTGGIAGVRVLQENREVGRTDAAGMLIVPDLHAFQVNHLSIDPSDLPPDVTLASRERDVRPQDRSGVVVKFPIRVSRGALLRLVREDGVPLPLGSVAQLRGGGAAVPVGYDGEAYVEGLGPHNHVSVQAPDGRRCAVEFEHRPVRGTMPVIGPLTCRGDAP